MLHDCREAAQAALPYQLEQAKYRKPKYLHATEKGLMPFSVWSIDTLPHMSPPAPDGSTSVVIGVDCTTKWAEVGTVRTLDSQSLAQWFHEYIVCRFGIPAIVRSD